MPRMTTLRQQIVRSHRPPGARRIKFPVRECLAFPAFADRIHDLPRGFHFVAADEQRRVAHDGFEQQPLVRLRRVRAELGIVAEVHPHRAHGEARAGDFAVEPQGNSLVRLEANRQRIGIKLVAALRGE